MVLAAGRVTVVKSASAAKCPVVLLTSVSRRNAMYKMSEVTVVTGLFDEAAPDTTYWLEPTGNSTTVTVKSATDRPVKFASSAW